MSVGIAGREPAGIAGVGAPIADIAYQKGCQPPARRGLHGERIGFGGCSRGLRGGSGVIGRRRIALCRRGRCLTVAMLKDDEDMTNVHLLRRLGFKESFAIVVGSIIGTGVFLKTAVMAQDAGPPLYVLLAWLMAGGRGHHTLCWKCTHLCMGEPGIDKLLQGRLKLLPRRIDPPETKSAECLQGVEKNGHRHN